MLTGFEALGAASAVLQVTSFASDLAVACKNAYDGATTSQDDLERYTGQMSEAVDCVHTRCEQMDISNSKFASPKLQNIAKECKDAAERLETEVQYVNSLQAKGDLVKSLRKAFRTSRHQKRLQALQESLAMYQQLMKTELTSHLCSQSDAIYFQQDVSFRKLDADVQFLINQLAEGITDVKDLVKQEHATTRNVIIQESARTELAINSHTDSQVLELRITVEAEKKCEVFLQSLKAPRMNQRYNDVMDSRDATFNQVFATYKDMKAMYYGDSEGNNKEAGDSKGNEFSETTRDLECMTHMEDIHRSWASFNSWLQSDDEIFYIMGKPGSGKSTLVKFILDQEQTQDLLRRWSPDAIIMSYFFWKIGSEEQNSIKCLWCSLLYQRLQDQQQLILMIRQHFSHLSSHSECHDWSIKDLQDVWSYIPKLDTRHICMFIDGLDEVRNQDGFSKLAQSIQLISQLPTTKLCISARPEAQIVRWLRTSNAAGILLEDLTRFDMLQFVRDRFRQIFPNNQISSKSSQDLRQKLVGKAQGVFLWLHLASRSIIDGIENADSGDMLLARLNALPGDLEDLYVDMWQRMNARSTVYQETARRYFRYVLQMSDRVIPVKGGLGWIALPHPLTFEIASAENPEIQEKVLSATGTIRETEILRICEETEASISTRCAGLLEVQSTNLDHHLLETREDDRDPFSYLTFIHRTAHDFLTDTEAGQGILGYEPLSNFSCQTRLLKGLICTVMVMTSEWHLVFDSDYIMAQITGFANRWGNEGLKLATGMLDVIQPLYDEGLLRYGLCPWIPQRPFLSHLTSDDLLHDFVISRLPAETSTHLVTSILRCSLSSGKALPERMFDKLRVLGADPHEYGVLDETWGPQPFVRRGTGFTNLLINFLLMVKRFEYEKPEWLYATSQRTLGIAFDMAKTCKSLDTTVALFAQFSETGHMQLMSWVSYMSLAGETFNHGSLFVVYEVNLRFLLLYLASKAVGKLAETVLASPQAQNILAKINSPSVKVRYFWRPQVTVGNKKGIISRPMFERVVPGVPPMSRSDIEYLFDVDFKMSSQELRMPNGHNSEPKTMAQYLEGTETEEVEVEVMMTSLAAENLGVCTYEEAGIIPSLEYLRDSRENNNTAWRLFPLSMERLEAAATAMEEMGNHESLD
ncbi:hypothetical protein ACKRZS_007163 [Fusarium odoratissimum]